MTKRLACLCASGLLVAALATPFTTSKPAGAVGARAAAPTCVPAQTDRRATAVRSALPVLLLGDGLNQPDDLQVTGDVVLVGQLGSGRIARFGVASAVGGFDLLPAIVPRVEGLTLIGTTQFAADQDADRIVTIDGATVTTFLQLRPVAGKEGVDGIGQVGNTLVVPDSPRGRVMFVGLDGKVKRVVRGFARPTGAWPLPSGAVLIADENGGTIVRIDPNGSKTTLVRGLRLPDDIVTDADGAIFTDSLGSDNLVQVANGRATEVAGNLQQPQGLAPDRAGNLLVTEFDNGRLDAVVRTFKLQPALTTAPSLAKGRSACVAFDRAPGFGAPVTIDAGAGYTVTAQPDTGSTGAIQPIGCTGLCTVQVTVRSGSRADAVWLQLQVA